VREEVRDAHETLRRESLVPGYGRRRARRFQQAGTVGAVRIVTDQFSGRSRGLGFAEVATREEAVLRKGKDRRRRQAPSLPEDGGA